MDRTFSREILKKQFILNSIRNNTEIVRNWAYPEATYRMLTEIYSLIKDNIFQKTKINVLCLIDFFMDLTNIIEERIYKHWKNLKEVIELNDKREIISKYIIHFSTTNKADELLELSRNFPSRKEFKYWLISHSDILLNELFKIDLDKCKNKFEGLLVGDFTTFLAKLSYKIGDLKEYNI